MSIFFSIQDVTHAYKSMMAEKQALEITLKALKTNSNLANEIKTQKTMTSELKSSNTSRSASYSDLSDTDSVRNKANQDTASNSNNPEAIKNGLSEHQEDKIAALTSNIQIIMENKAKMEANYLAEKKKLRVFEF
jgi:hypothetical protein